MAGSFSFATPEEVMHVLASIRSSSANAAQQSELRDLVLSYTNGGKDPSLKIQIEQRLTALGVVPSEQATSLSTSEPLDFGSSRNVPSFAASQPVAAPAPTTPQPAPAAPQPVAVVDPAQTTAQPAPATASTPAPQPVVPVSQPPVPPPAVVPAPTASQPAPAPVSTPPADPAPTPAAPAVNFGGDPLQRIREIKALVNEKVGNPVNLVDIDNTVGREYMAALLEAMKKVNSGSDPTSAMNRLETAYASVEDVLKNKPTTPPAVPKPAEPELPTSPAPAQVPEPEPIPAPPEPPKPAEPVSEPVSVPINSSITQRPAPAQHSTPDDSASRWANTEIRTTTAVPPISTPEPAVKAEIPETPSPVQAPVVTPAAQSAPTVVAPVTPTAPVAPAGSGAVKPLSATGEPLKSVTDLPAPDSLDTAKDGDPLHTREVDDGLNQLLSDWVLFRKSGLLGTGPKGIEHPLFKKIKDLQIPILLAGRFEGATQDIKQSITDYMNGWRYEQGIIYEQGETFEHYLRRVIRHILDLQK